MKAYLILSVFIIALMITLFNCFDSDKTETLPTAGTTTNTTTTTTVTNNNTNSTGSTTSLQWTYEDISAINVGSTTWGLNDVITVSDEEAWAVGYKNTWSTPAGILLLHRTSVTWSEATCDMSGTAYHKCVGVSAVDTNNVFFCAIQSTGSTRRGHILKWNGTAVVDISPTFSTPALWEPWSISVVSAGDVWVCGTDRSNSPQSGMVLHYDGSSWTHYDATSGNFPTEATNVKLSNISATGSIVYAIGNIKSGSPDVPVIYTWDSGSTTWSKNTSLTYVNEIEARCLDIQSQNNIWMGFNTAGTTSMVYNYNGSTWTDLTPPLTVAWGVKGISINSDNVVFGAGSQGTTKTGLILALSFTTWNNETLPTISSPYELVDIDMYGNTSGYAVGNLISGTYGVILKYTN